MLQFSLLDCEYTPHPVALRSWISRPTYIQLREKLRIILGAFWHKTKILLQMEALEDVFNGCKNAGQNLFFQARK